MNLTVDNSRRAPEGASLLQQFVLFALLGAGGMYVTYALGHCDYALFRGVVDLIGVMVALAVFVVTWHTRFFSADDAGLCLGIAYLWVGIIQGFHMLAYGWPPEPAAAPVASSMPLWSVSRLLEAGALATFPFLRGRRLPHWAVHVTVGAVGLGALAWIVRNGNSSPDQVRSMVLATASVLALATCVLFVTAGIAVLRKRTAYDDEVAMLLLCSLAFNVVAESVFVVAPVHRLSPWGIVPSLCRLVALLLLYKALVGSCLGRPYDVLFRDLRQRDRSLQESQSRYMSVVEDVPVMICSMQPDSTITFANSQFCAILGIARDAVTGSRFLQLIPEDVRADAAATLRSLSPSAPVASAEHDILLQSGLRRRHRWTHRGLFDSSGTLVGLQSCGEDITAKVRDREQVTRLATAVEQATEAITIMDHDGQILYVNPAFETLSGYTSDEALGNDIANFMGCEHKRELLHEISDAIHKENVWRGRIRNLTKQGVAYEEEISVTGQRDADGRLANIVAVARDITREEDMARQLRQAQKMDALGRLAGGVAHDFNNVLQIVGTNAELALDDITSQRQLGAHLRDILAAVRKAEALVRRLLTFSRHKEGRRQVIDVDRLVSRFGSLAERLLGEHIRLNIETGGNSKPVLADPDEIEQALLNLILNARDAMPDGGTLHVRTRCEHVIAEASAELARGREGEFTVLEVEDTGSGIDPDVLEHVFEPFFTTKPLGDGTGLGLAIVYGAVERHGGFARIASELRRGTRVTLYFPVTDRREQTPEEAPTETGRPRSQNRTHCVLLAEDNAMVRHAGVRILERAGYEVLTAADGIDALRLFEQNRDSIDALVLDVMMPGCGGKHVWAHVRASADHIPVVFCTGYSESALDDDVLRDTAVTVIRKPYQRNDLLKALRRLLAAGDR